MLKKNLHNYSGEPVRDQIRQFSLLKGGEILVAYFTPRLVNSARFVSRTEFLTQETALPATYSVYRFDDVEQAYRFGWTCEPEPAPHPLLGIDDPGLNQGLQQLAKVVLRRTDALGNLGRALELTRLLSRHGQGL